MEFLYLLIAVVLGSLGTIVYFNYAQEKKHAEILKQAPMSFAQMYAFTLERFSNPSITRSQPSNTLLWTQKNLLQALGEAGELVEQVRSISKQPEHLLPRFLVNLNDTVFDRNGCVELWVDVADDVSEVYYLGGEHLSLITDLLRHANSTFNKQLESMTKGIVK